MPDWPTLRLEQARDPAVALRLRLTPGADAVTAKAERRVMAQGGCWVRSGEDVVCSSMLPAAMAPSRRPSHGRAPQATNRRYRGDAVVSLADRFSCEQSTTADRSVERIAGGDGPVIRSGRRRSRVYTAAVARDEALERWLAEVPTGARRLVTDLRDLVRHAAPMARESVLWGSLSYHVAELGGRIKGSICFITPKRDYVELGFVHGQQLADPERLLSGSGKAKRSIRFPPASRIPKSAVRDLLRDALHQRLMAAAAL
jgi:hypothetical protein